MQVQGCFPQKYFEVILAVRKHVPDIIEQVPGLLDLDYVPATGNRVPVCAIDRVRVFLAVKAEGLHNQQTEGVQHQRENLLLLCS